MEGDFSVPVPAQIATAKLRYQQHTMDVPEKVGPWSDREHEGLMSPISTDSKSSRLKRLFNSLQFWTFFSYCFVFAITSAFWNVYFLYPTSMPHIFSAIDGVPRYNSTLMPGRNYYSCGGSLESAKARGCKYDILNNDWVPAQCLDQSAIEEYQSDGSWFGYADFNHTKPLTIEAMGDSSVYYTSARDHIVHCAMLWRKQFRAWKEDRDWLDALIIEEEHTVHCSQYLMDMTTWGPNFREIPIAVEVGYSGCHIRD